MNYNIGKALKEMREEQNHTVLEVANALTISHQNIYRWEAGQVIPTITQCIKLADFYGCTLDELIDRKI